jgi:glycosyltransferase involved in cell wall biosynthesis
MIADEWQPYFGGAGLCMGLFAHELSSRGHTVAVATAWHKEMPVTEMEGEVAVHRIRELPSRMGWASEDPNRHSPAPFPDPEAIWRLRRIIKEFRPDIIPAYGWIAHSAAVALAGQEIPLVIWGHDYANACAMRTLYRLEREICSGPGLAKCMACSVSGRGLVKGSLAAAGVLGTRPLLRRKATALHGVSKFVAAELSRDVGAPGAPSVVINNFHEDEEPGAIDEAIMAQLPDRPYILYVGVLSKVKGVPNLVAAYEKLADPPPLVMVGYRTPDTPPALPPGCTVLSDVPHRTVMEMWERALFGVFPSIWAEPLATVVHEAMSKGRPTIGTAVGGHPDMIDDGESGFIVAPGDVEALAAAMETLGEDEELRRRMGAVALERAKRFTREVVVPQLESFYEETAARAPARD